MIRRIATRSALPAVLAMAAAAALTVTTAPAAHAVGENSRCTVNWANFGATVGKNAWNYRSGPATGYKSKGYLYRGDKLKVFCSKGSWNYSQLTQRSKSGIPKGTKGWVRNDGLISLAG
ncbi:SH3 domain-containing protein [Streptomyces sp. NBC_01142]|uniref:SH3 domain-containing protein n=1 Tax=Streptomyces sp. NBC_01142 TaxID=2975865 RepID=UPI0022582D00|nr:SH3 domain-containing protein [Streptomyces sp. NBC_01142]MCX4826939.1 SH3 domain-containing protein [Streptomyces sp. NBC_01142]